MSIGRPGLYWWKKVSESIEYSEGLDHLRRRKKIIGGKLSPDPNKDSKINTNLIDRKNLKHWYIQYSNPDVNLRNNMGFEGSNYRYYL